MRDIITLNEAFNILILKLGHDVSVKIFTAAHLHGSHNQIAPQYRGSNKIDMNSSIKLTMFTIIGFSAGVAATWGMIFYPIGDISVFINTSSNVAIYMTFGFTVSLTAVFPILFFLLKHFLKRTSGSVTKIIQHGRQAFDAYESSNRRQVAAELEAAAAEYIAWYAPIAARRWSTQMAIAALVAMGGLASTALLFRQLNLMSAQNEKIQEQTDLLKHQINLLSEQNGKIDLQTITSEAQRKSILSTELSSIIQSVTEYVSNKRLKENLYQNIDLPDEMNARIINFSRAAIPYWTIEVQEDNLGGSYKKVPVISDQSRSLERGQLILSLLSSRAIIPIEIVLVNSDLRNINIRNYSMSFLTMEQSQFRMSKLENIDFVSANLVNSHFQESKISNVVFDRANLTGANFTDAELSNVHFYESNLSSVNFSGTLLTGINWQRAIIGLDTDETIPEWAQKLPEQWEIKSIDNYKRIVRKDRSHETGNNPEQHTSNESYDNTIE